MKNVKHTLLTLTMNLAAVLAIMVATSHAQTWQTLYSGPGHVQSALLDSFSSHPQPSLFIGGRADRSPADSPFSIQWVGPFDGVALPAAAISDNDAGWSHQLGFDAWSGRLYSVGSGDLGWQVRESVDEGGTWTTVDAPYASGSASGFASDGQGNVFVCGTANGHWIVRKRNSSGVWSTIRDRSAAKKSYAAAKMTIVSGFLIVVGELDGSQWSVERMGLAQNTWQTLYTGAPKGKKAGAVAVTSFGSDIYVLAWVGRTGAAPESCLLLKGANLGAGSWTSVKSFAESPNINRPSDVAFDASGNLYVVGDSTFPTSTGSWPEAWIVRRCDAVTGVWQWCTPLTNDPATQRSFARQISVVTTSGEVFITGTAQDIVGGQLTQNWRVIVQGWVP